MVKTFPTTSDFAAFVTTRKCTMQLGSENKEIMSTAAHVLKHSAGDHRGHGRDSAEV